MMIFDDLATAYDEAAMLEMLDEGTDRPAEYAGMSVQQIRDLCDEYDREVADALSYLHDLINDTPEWRG